MNKKSTFYFFWKRERRVVKWRKWVKWKFPWEKRAEIIVGFAGCTPLYVKMSVCLLCKNMGGTTEITVFVPNCRGEGFFIVFAYEKPL